MKRILLLFAAAILTVGVYAQKYAVVNTESIFKAVPEYSNAMNQLDAMAKKEQAKIDAEYDKIAEMYDRYQAQKQSLSLNSQKQIEDNIIALEKNAADMQKNVFGNEGTIMKKRVELLKPIQDRVFKVIDTMATAKGYDMIFDISNNPSVVFFNKSTDLTKEVLKLLGITK